MTRNERQREILQTLNGADPSFGSAEAERVSTYSQGPDVIIHIAPNGDYVATSRDDDELARSSTDVGPVVETAINASIPGVEGGTTDNSILWGSGLFDWLTPITVNNAFTFHGQGRNRTHINNDTGDIALEVGSGASAITEVFFMKWDGKGSNRGNAHINANGSSEFTAAFCEFRNTVFQGLKLDNVGQLNHLHNCWFLSSTAGNPGFVAQGSTNELWVEACSFAEPAQIRVSNNVRFVNNQVKGRGQLQIYRPNGGPFLVANNQFRRSDDTVSKPLIYIPSVSSSDNPIDLRIDGNTFYDETTNADTGIDIEQNLSQIEIYNNTFDASLGTTINAAASAEYRTYNNDGHDDFQSFVPFPSPSAGDWYYDDGTNTGSGTRGKRVYDGTSWNDAWTL